MTDTRTIAPNEEPVCGMTVDVNEVPAKGLTLIDDGREFVFRGKSCVLEFRDDPEAFLAPDYTPAM